MRVRSRHLACLLLLGILALAFIPACSRTIDHNASNLQQSLGGCKIVQHMMGEACIPYTPQRVVTLWMGTFRSSLALGIKPIATAWYVNEPFPNHLHDEADGVENIGFEPSLEKILALKPDLILSTTRFESIYKQLSRIAPTVVLDISMPPPPWQKHLEDVAKIFSRKEKGSQLIDDYWQRVEQLKQALGDRQLQMQVSIATVDPIYGIYIYGKAHPAGKVLNDIGLQRPPAQNGDFFTKSNISYEHLSDIDGDILFISHRGGEAARKSLENLQQSPLWQKLKVVQRNKVYLVDSAHWYAFDVLAMNAIIDDLFKYLIEEEPTF